MTVTSSSSPRSTHLRPTSSMSSRAPRPWTPTGSAMRTHHPCSEPSTPCLRLAPCLTPSDAGACPLVRQPHSPDRRGARRRRRASSITISAPPCNVAASRFASPPPPPSMPPLRLSCARPILLLFWPGQRRRRRRPPRVRTRPPRPHLVAHTSPRTHMQGHIQRPSTSSTSKVQNHSGYMTQQEDAEVDAARTWLFQPAAMKTLQK